MSNTSKESSKEVANGNQIQVVAKSDESESEAISRTAITPNGVNRELEVVAAVDGASE